MSDITVSISDERLIKLEEKADRLGITLKDLVLLGIDEILSRPDEDFLQAVDYVMKKNAELYRRLA